MLLTQAQFDHAFAHGTPAVKGNAVAGLNPVCVVASGSASVECVGVYAGLTSALRMALISWQDRIGAFATHATPVRFTPRTENPGSQPRPSERLLPRA